VTSQVSHPYRSTDFTQALNILIGIINKTVIVAYIWLLMLCISLMHGQADTKNIKVYH
jgi:hypothetical protein